MVTTIVVIVIVVVLLALWLMSAYNRLVRLKNQVHNAWAQIDVQLQRRYDLIPNLIECVKEYMQYEKGTLEAVVEARSEAMKAREKVEDGANLGDLMQAEVKLKGALGNIFALAENYPDLKASDNMRNLQEELTSTENKVAFSRQAYNDNVLLYNTEQQQFPTMLVAGMYGHKPADLYEVDEEKVRKAVKVEF